MGVRSHEYLEQLKELSDRLIARGWSPPESDPEARWVVGGDGYQHKIFDQRYGSMNVNTSRITCLASDGTADPVLALQIAELLNAIDRPGDVLRKDD